MLANDAALLIEDLADRSGPEPEDYGELAQALQVLHRHEFVVKDGLSTRIATHAGLHRTLNGQPSIFRSTASLQGFV